MCTYEVCLQVYLRVTYECANDTYECANLRVYVRVHARVYVRLYLPQCTYQCTYQWRDAYGVT